MSPRVVRPIAASPRSRSSAIGIGRPLGVSRTGTRPCRPRTKLHPIGAPGAENIHRPSNASATIMSRTSAASASAPCGSRPAASRRARAPRPTGRSLGRFQRADNRRHHRDLGAGPDPDARPLNVQFDDAGMPIRRFALNAALRRRRRSRRFDDHRRKRQIANLLFSLSTRLATRGEQLLRRQTMATRDLADQGRRPRSSPRRSPPSAQPSKRAGVPRR
jgi:hypothetical protein